MMPTVALLEEETWKKMQHTSDNFKGTCLDHEATQTIYAAGAEEEPR